MDTQNHSRTKQIKVLSKHLYHVLTVIYFGLFLGWPAIVFVFFAPSGTLTVGDSALAIETLNTFSKALILSLFSVGLAIMIKISSHFRQLMRHFMLGNIFIPGAIAQVRGALSSGVLFFLLSIIQTFVGAEISSTNTPNFSISFSANLLVAGTFFGLMYTLLWALEIGCDLNEESELTV